MHSQRFLFSMIIALVIFGATAQSATAAAASSAPTASCTGTSGSLTLKVSAVRDTGISPFLVFFDATGTTDTSISGNTTAFQDVSYTWNFAHDDAAYNLKSVVTFTLSATSKGTLLRMEQLGFRPDQKQAYGGARAGWQQFFANLEQVLARIG